MPLVEGIGVMRDVFLSSSENLSVFDTDTTSTVMETTTTALPVTAVTGLPLPMCQWCELTTGKIITLLLISFTIPVAFMLLLFWRLQKEKKYMNARGALVYRETVLVPSYTNNDSENSNNNNYLNVVQMHSALYDTPPDYEEVVPSSMRTGNSENAGENNKNCKMEDLPPPSYSTVYI